MGNTAASLVILSAVLWGCIGLFLNRLAAHGVSDMQAVVLRSGLAACSTGIFILVRNPRLFRIRAKDLWCFAGTGAVSLTTFNYCYFSAIRHTQMSVAAAFLYTAPAFVILLSRLLFSESITARKICALALTLAGCFFVSGAAAAGLAGVGLPGLLYGVGAGFFYALYSIFGRYALNKGYSSLTIVFYTFVLSVLSALPIMDSHGLAAALSNASAILSALGLGIVSCSLPYVFYTAGLSRLHNGKASILASLELVVASLIGYLVFHEAMSGDKITGAAMIFASVIVLNIRIGHVRNSGQIRPVS